MLIHELPDLYQVIRGQGYKQVTLISPYNNKEVLAVYGKGLCEDDGKMAAIFKKSSGYFYYVSCVPDKYFNDLPEDYNANEMSLQVLKDLGYVPISPVTNI